jgi:hypothetical protein
MVKQGTDIDTDLHSETSMSSTVQTVCFQLFQYNIVVILIIIRVFQKVADETMMLQCITNFTVDFYNFLIISIR